MAPANMRGRFNVALGISEIAVCLDYTTAKVAETKANA
jgi:hypothetical protein